MGRRDRAALSPPNERGLIKEEWGGGVKERKTGGGLPGGALLSPPFLFFSPSPTVGAFNLRWLMY